ERARRLRFGRRAAPDPAVEDGEIQSPIMIKIGQNGPKARSPPARTRQSRRGSPVLKHPSGPLPPQGVGLFGEVGHEDVEKALANNVPKSNPHVGLCLPQTIEGQAAHGGFFLERPVFLVDPQVVRLFIVGDKNIGPAVAIEIGADYPESWTRKLAKSRFQGYVFETDGERGARSAER